MTQSAFPLNSTSIFYGKENINEINIDLSDLEIKNEINKYSANYNYLLELNNSGNLDELKLISKEEHECERISKDTKPLKSSIEALKIECLNYKFSAFDSSIKQEKFCECYGKWFYNKTNQEEFNIFLNLTTSEKEQFLVKNEIIKMCRFYSENFESFDKTLKKNNN